MRPGRRFAKWHSPVASIPTRQRPGPGTATANGFTGRHIRTLAIASCVRGLVTPFDGGDFVQAPDSEAVMTFGIGRRARFSPPAMGGKATCRGTRA